MSRKLQKFRWDQIDWGDVIHRMLNRAVFQGVPASARRSAGVFRQQNRVFTATIAVASQQNSSIDFSNAETAFKVVVNSLSGAFLTDTRDS